MEAIRKEGLKRKVAFLNVLKSLTAADFDTIDEQMLLNPELLAAEVEKNTIERAKSAKCQVKLIPLESMPAHMKVVTGPKKKNSRRTTAPPEPSRRSTRLSEQPNRFSYKLEDFFDDDDFGRRRKKRRTDDDGDWKGEKQRSSQLSRGELKPYVARENSYGEIEDIPVGHWWATRMECSRDGIHRPPVSGIHGGADGAYSIAVSGGYAENEDNGTWFWFTGEGGRDLKGTASNPKNLRTAEQSKDQELTRGNLALYRSFETKNPVRVIRGFSKNKDCTSPWAPEDGYRYDGLYQVTKWQEDVGRTGFKVFRFKLDRIKGQPPILQN